MKRKLQLKITNPLMGSKFELPSYASIGSAGMDLRACISESITIEAGEQVVVPTGIALQLLDPGLVGIVASRSGLSSRNRINVAQGGGGIIDSDYTGEIKIILENRGKDAFEIKPGTRIAQLVITPVIQIDYVVVEEFEEDTERGEGGLGSTGLR